VVSPHAAYLVRSNFWLGIAASFIAFFMWGMGFNFASVSYLSLATELSGESRGKTVSIMWFMMISAIIVTALTLSRMLTIYTPARLENAFAAVGLASLVLSIFGLVGLEKRSVPVGATTGTGVDEQSLSRGDRSWTNLFRIVTKNRQVGLFFLYLTILLAALLGQEILLEPYGAEAFGMPVSATTRITAIWGTFMLITLLIGGVIERRAGKRNIAVVGGITAIVGFILILSSGLSRNEGVFYIGITLLGAGTGLSTVSNLSLMLDMTVQGRVGVFMGVWGMSSAAARVFGSVLGGSFRDIAGRVFGDPVLGYVAIFGVMALFIAASLVLLPRIDVAEFQEKAAA